MASVNIIDIRKTVSLDGAIPPVTLDGGTLYGGEDQAHRFIITAKKNGEVLNLTGVVNAKFIRKADDAEVELTGEIIGGAAAVTLLASCYTEPGRFELSIFVTSGGSKTCVYNVNGNVKNTSAGKIVDPGHVVPDVSDIVAEYERMQAASDAAEAAAANANEAAQFATDDEWTNGDTLQTGRVYQTLHMANFEEETAGQYLRVISGNVAQAERVNQSGWSVYRYDLPHRMLIRLESIEKNTPTVQGVLPMAAVLTSGNTETLYSLDSDRTGTYVLADALLTNYNTTLNASAIKSVSITAVANRQFEDVIVCLDHAADFDKIVVFGDSIFANYISSTTVGNGVMAQFASLMGLPVVNNAVGGATLSTIQTSPKNVVQQVQDYIASATPGGTPLYMIDGGTNDQYNNGAGLANLGQYTDGVNGITNTIYGATYRIINDLLGFGAQPWQIVITTPIPKGIRGDAAYTATMDAQLTAIAGAMAEIAMVQQCNVINGYGAPFDNLTTDTAKAIIMPDDTHPSVYGAKLYAERIFRLLGVANQQEVASLKSALSAFDGINHINVVSQDGKKYITPSGNITSASGNYHVSNPISVSAGDEARFTCRVAGDNIIPIALCDSNGGNIVPVVAGVSGDTLHEYIYDVQEDGYIILSYRFDVDYKLVILDRLSNVSIKHVADVNRKTIEEQCGVTKVDFVFVNGKKYITANGNIESSIAKNHVSKPIQVRTGDKIDFIASSISQTTVIALCNADSTNVIPKVIAEDNDEHIYSLDIETDGYVIVSYLYDNPADLYLLKDYANKRLKDAVDNLVVASGNLINHRTMIDDTAVANNGTLVSNVQYAATEKIPVKPSTTYSYRNIYRVVYYNSNNVRIGAYATNVQLNTGNFTTPANTAYIRLCVLKYNTQVGKIYDTTQWQLVEGTSLPDYEQQKIVVDGYRIADTTAITHNKVTAFRRWDKICYDKEPTIFASTESDAITAEDMMTSAIIAKYDALMTDNPLYISKTALGTASDGTTTIYRYDFKTPRAKVTTGSIPISSNEKTKIILISGVHPEFGGIYGLYNAMREITNNPALANIKNGVHFVVIPTVNPYGIDTKNRKNANGVDIARNFEIDYVAGTDPTSSTYAGTEPLSEPESQIVNTVLSENRDAIMFASCHSFQLSSDNNVIWGSCASMYTTNVTAKVVEKLSYAWRNKYTSIIPQTIDTILGSTGISTESGSEGKQATKYGIQGLTLESSDYFPYDSQTPHTSFAISRASEVYLNFIATALGLWESSDPKDLNTIGIC